MHYVWINVKLGDLVNNPSVESSGNGLGKVKVDSVNCIPLINGLRNPFKSQPECSGRVCLLKSQTGVDIRSTISLLIRSTIIHSTDLQIMLVRLIGL